MSNKEWSLNGLLDDEVEELNSEVEELNSEQKSFITFWSVGDHERIFDNYLIKALIWQWMFSKSM